MSAIGPARFISDLFAPHSVEAHSGAASLAFVDALFPDEADHLSPMASGRRAEYATGRACARAALTNLVGDNAGHVDLTIRRDERGAPLWPAGTTGSISHTEGFCAAIAAHNSSGLESVGIDMERIDRVGERVRKRILTSAELHAVQAMAPALAQMHTAIAFAAKEAFYKAQYQLTSTYLGFGAVEVDVVDDELAFRSTHSAVSDFIANSTGRLTTKDGLVVAAVWVNNPA